MATQLLLTEVSDEQIKIGGVLAPTEGMKKVARCFNAAKSPFCIDVEHVETLLDDTITKAAAAGEIQNNILTFKQPVIISKKQEKKAASGSASGFTVNGFTIIDDANKEIAKVRGLGVLHDAVLACGSGSLEKVATNQFTEDLIDAIHDSQISSEGVMKLSMPIKLEFRDDAAKTAFLGIGRRKKAKAVKLASAVKSVYRRQLVDMAIERLTK